MKYLPLLLLGLCLQCAPNVPKDAWQDLFNGKDLSNWEKRNGNAEYEIRGDVIAGISQANTPNTFLCTREMYGDFILEMEVKVDPLLNSGVQIRTNSIPEYQGGVVHGYQVEIDPSPRAFSGGIYDESRRGWLYPLCENEEGRKAFKNGEWNHYHIEAIGHELRVWVNGVNTANVLDDLTASGFIGLQVHAIGKPEEVGKEIQWRKLRIKTSDLAADRWNDKVTAKVANYLPHHLSAAEKADGWQLLWDGTEVALNAVILEDWDVKDGQLRPKKDLERVAEFNLGPYKKFELKVDFQVSNTGAGALSYLNDPSNQNPLRYRLCKDTDKAVPEENRLASLYQLIAAENLCVPGRGKYYRGQSYWNQARLVVNQGQVQHWLNGYLLVTYDLNADKFQNLLAGKQQSLNQTQRGVVKLLGENTDIAFRSIKLRTWK